jgi:hypothetical protein
VERKIKRVRDFEMWELEEIFGNETCGTCQFFEDGLGECWREEGKPISVPSSSACRNWQLHKSLEAQIEKYIDSHERFDKKA